MEELAAHACLHRQMQALLDFLNITASAKSPKGACCKDGRCKYTDAASCKGVFCEGCACMLGSGEDPSTASLHLLEETARLLASLHDKSSGPALPFPVRAGRTTYRLD